LYVILYYSRLILVILPQVILGYYWLFHHKAFLVILNYFTKVIPL
jgi:hypothetical protein